MVCARVLPPQELPEHRPRQRGWPTRTAAAAAAIPGQGALTVVPSLYLRVAAAGDIADELAKLVKKTGVMRAAVVMRQLVKKVQEQGGEVDEDADVRAVLTQAQLDLRATVDVQALQRRRIG